MNVFVTGAAGFIGHRVCQLLLSQRHQVLGADNLNNYYDVRLKQLRLKLLSASPNFSFVKMDIESLPALEKIFKNNRFDAVIHLAARAGVRASVANPFIYESTNTLGTLNLLEVLVKQKRIPKLVFASSSSVYAGCRPPFKETMDVKSPLSPYAATKMAG